MTGQNKMTESQSGQLHIFFGAAPGVGKTWAMVDAGQQKKAEGVDVVIGFVDTHDRPEFLALLNGLEIIPTQNIEYQDIPLQELDVNAILLRRPDIVLIDDLAHSNVPGSHHAKRYQDVIELLQSGIAVYTTLSVQYVASVADVVAHVTGIQVQEQVPDFVLEMATSIRLIDLTPDELLNRLSKRLHARKTNAPDIPDLIKPEHLVTLREIALRIAASRVGEDIEKQQELIEPWLNSSRIVVGVSASPTNERLLRAACRLVREMRTTWLAVHIQTVADNRLDQESQERIQRHLQLAKELGAETLAIAGQDTARQLVEIAEQYQATRIVVGRSKKRGPFGRTRSLADEIIELSDTIDVIILSG
jgi:two-component system sensor histidine kinase KdpD